MINPHENKKLLEKLERCLTVFEPYLFTVIAQPPFVMFETDAHLRCVPDMEKFNPPSEYWGHDGGNAWFRMSYVPDESFNGKPLYIMPRVGGYEAMLWVDGKPCGTFATKIVVTRHGNHYCDMICAQADSAHTYEIAIEFYAGHSVEGCQPFEVTQTARGDFSYCVENICICKKNQLVADFLYDLRCLVQLAQVLEEDSFFRSHILNTLAQVHCVLRYDPTCCAQETWLQSLQLARDAMKPCLERTNGSSAPHAILTGHSHMDTAWLWPVSETIRKNARTMSNQLSLMRQFPEYRFVQSSSLHSHMIETQYPALFEEIRAQIEAGRYEINGAVWVECDCNLTGGESLVRQFLWGQRYTKEKFGILSDCFWLPDTFGYSAALPQIMQGFGVKYFLTTKLAWNDTNAFPWETFVWEGLDKSKVLSHFFVMDTWPDPKGLLERVQGKNYADCIHNKQVSQKRLIAFGYGDGGGGPQFEMIELARRMKNLEGCPKTRYSSVSAFLQELETDAQTKALPIYKGELYLELHRGTLTAQQKIKKNNRLCEIALHNLELLTVFEAIKHHRTASDCAYRDLWGILLKNQFHDILPGSCIPKAHDESIQETTALLKEATKQIQNLFCANSESEASWSVFNPLGFSREDIIYLPTSNTQTPLQLFDSTGNTFCAQVVSLLNDKTALAVAQVKQKAFSTTVLMSKAEDAVSKSSFVSNENTLQTPFYRVTFGDAGAISSLIDLRTPRELCSELPLNTFVTAEDVPAAWDGWDIDADCLWRLAPDMRLLRREIVANGAVEYRIRSSYSLCQHTTLHQDMIFYAHSPLIAFDNALEWNDKHHLLQVVFDTTVQNSFARYETQFGYIQRPTTRNNSIEQAMFEVCNHKYTDLSEPGYGITVLNDCKYGASVHGGRITLTLAKGGVRPDPRGDCGLHTFCYAFLPHAVGFTASDVVQPAYCFNILPLVAPGNVAHEKNVPIETQDSNIIIETIKPCEDAQKAFIIRLYECEGTWTSTNLMVNIPHTQMFLCDMMESPIAPCNKAIVFNPFEIKTIKICY